MRPSIHAMLEMYHSAPVTIRLQAEDGGVADDATIAQCAGDCITPGCGTISPFTSDLVACLKEACFAECLQQ